VNMSWNLIPPCCTIKAYLNASDQGSRGAVTRHPHQERRHDEETQRHFPQQRRRWTTQHHRNGSSLREEEGLEASRPRPPQDACQPCGVENLYGPKPREHVSTGADQVLPLVDALVFSWQLPWPAEGKRFLVGLVRYEI